MRFGFKSWLYLLAITPDVFLRDCAILNPSLSRVSTNHCFCSNQMLTSLLDFLTLRTLHTLMAAVEAVVP